MARNNATPIRISTDPTCRTSTISPTVTAAPPVAVIPIANGDRQLNRGPRVPLGASVGADPGRDHFRLGDLSLGRGMRLTDQLVVPGLRHRRGDG